MGWTNYLPLWYPHIRLQCLVGDGGPTLQFITLCEWYSKAQSLCGYNPSITNLNFCFINKSIFHRSSRESSLSHLSKLWKGQLTTIMKTLTIIKLWLCKESIIANWLVLRIGNWLNLNNIWGARHYHCL